jgi:hypothetical protein
MVGMAQAEAKSAPASDATTGTVRLNIVIAPLLPPS